MATDNLKDHPTVSDPMAGYQRIPKTKMDKIPGLAYTDEERISAVRKTMAQIRAGETGMASEDVWKKYQKLFKEIPE